MPLNFKKLVAIFASKFFRFSGTIGKCAAKPLRAGGFLPLTAFRLNRALNSRPTFCGDTSSSGSLLNSRPTFGGDTSSSGSLLNSRPTFGGDTSSSGSLLNSRPTFGGDTSSSGSLLN